MPDINLIRENPDEYKKAAKDKRMDTDIDRLLALDAQIRAILVQVEALRARRNTLSKQIPALHGNEKDAVMAQMRALRQTLTDSEAALKTHQLEFDNIMLTVPSLPAPDVPVGLDDADNVELRRVGKRPEFDFPFRDHLELAELLDIVEIPRAVKFAGSRSYLLKNEGVLLENAVCRFALDFLRKRGFTPMTVPYLVREGAMRGTGYFPLGYEQAYKLPEDQLFLIGTSEVALVSYHEGELLDLDSLPLRYAGYSACFRREAGTYGKDTRGLYRVHQFQKVEQVVFCRNDEAEAYRLHDELLGNAELILQALELPYRVALACTGETGIGQIRKHEVETWMPSRDAYCETHSCSTMGDFQSRRLNIRYRDEGGDVK